MSAPLPRLDRWFPHRTLRPGAVSCIIADVVSPVLVRTGVASSGA